MEENLLTSCYRLVPYYGLPVRLFIIRFLDKDEDNKIFNMYEDYVIENPRNALFRFIVNKINLNEIILFFRKYLKDYSELDLYMLYFQAYNDIFDQFNSIVEYKENKYSDDYILDIISRSINYANEVFMFYKENLKYVHNEPGIELFIKNEVNRFVSTMNGTENYNHFDSYQSLEDEFNNWFFIPKLQDPNDYISSTESIQSQIILDLIKLQKIKERSKLVSEINISDNDFLFTPIDIKSATFLYKPVNDYGDEFTEEDGYDIFSYSNVSEYIPYIRYMDHKGQAWTKLYKEERIDELPDYDNIIVDIVGSEKNNTISAILWLGEIKNPGKKMYESQKDTFFKIIYNLDKKRNDYNTLEIETILFKNEENEKYTIQKVKDAFPMLNLVGTPKEGKIRCEFSIYNIKVNEKSFFHLIQNNTPYNYFFKTLENNIYFAFKKNVQLGFYREKLLDDKIKPDIKFVINQRTTLIEENKRLINSKNKQIDKLIESGVDYIKIIINRSNSRDLLMSFIRALKLCLSSYVSTKGKNNKLYIDKLYDNYLPNLYDIGNISDIKEKSIIKHLKEVAPEIFVGGYARVCPPSRQPIIINAKNKKEWEDKGLIPRPFPKENPYLFVCPRDPNKKGSAIYLGIQRNRGLKSRNEYPYVPCCFIKPTDDEEGSYTRYINNQFSKNPIAKVTILISRPSILPPFKPSYVPSTKIYNVLSKNEKNIYRRGTVFSPNSFLHCIADALFPEYEKLKNDEDREEFVIKIRHKITENINPAVMKQELYEYSPKEIIDSINNVTSFFDPIYYYRSIEELYNINIFLFGIQSGIEKDKSITDEGYIQIPNYKLFYSNYFKPERTNILILRNWGSDSNDLLIPQCELLVHYDFDDKILYKSFNEHIGKICYDALMNSIQTYTCILNRKNYTDQNPNPINPIIVYKNIYTIMDHFKIYSGKPISQYIDPYGKLRAINFEVENKIITICTIPSKPENLPIENKIYKIEYEYAIKYMGINPSSISINTDDMVEGLWFNIIGIQQGEYIPIIPVNKSIFSKYPEGEKCYILSKNIEITNRLNKLRKYLNIIIQVIRWFFELFIDQYNNNLNFPKDKKLQIQNLIKDKGILSVEYNLIEIFLEWYTLTNQVDCDDSANFYNLDKIPYRFPKIKTLEDALDYIYNLSENFIVKDKNNKKILFYNNEFYKKIRSNLYNFNKLSLDPITYIKGYYTNESDFKVNNNTILFNNDNDLEKWITNVMNDKINKNTKFSIRDKIGIKDWKLIEPYLFRNIDNKLYLIQNTIEGSKNAALFISQNWIDKGINYGYENLNELVKLPDHIIYSVDDLGNLKVSVLITGDDNFTEKIDFSDPNKKIAQIFYYNPKNSKTGSKKYAALLNIL